MNLTLLKKSYLLVVAGLVLMTALSSVSVFAITEPIGICHAPGGDVSKGNFISVGNPAYASHLNSHNKDVLVFTEDEKLACNGAEENTPPEITLVDGDLELTAGDVYTDPGYSASDIEDGDITVDVVVAGDAVDTGTPGVYVVTYDVEDSDGAFAIQKTRTITVVPVDMCPNIAEIQETIPEGYELVDGDCELIPEPVDVCPLLDGVQETVPEGYELIEGYCELVEDPVDMCPNIEGDQETVPQGYELVDGDCELIPEPNVCTADLNLVQNPGFELPVVEHSRKWDLFDNGTTNLDWNVVWESPTIKLPEIATLEVHRGVFGWLPYEGEQYTELDGDAPVEIFQELATVTGEDYTISFAFSPRPGTDGDDNILKVYWEGVLVDTIIKDGSDNSNTLWTTHEYTVTATSDSSEFRFVDAGDANKKGTLVDDVSVTCDVEGDPFYGSLRGDKYYDEDEDGSYNYQVDSLIGLWVINLYDADWGFLSSDETNVENGAYNFNSLDLGTYRICEELPGGWSQTAPVGVDRDFVTVVSNESSNSENEAGNCYEVVVDGSDDNIGGLDFGNVEKTYPYGIITNPLDGDFVSGLINLTAEYFDGDDENDDAVNWAVRQGTCTANTNTVAGNVDGFNDPFDWDGNLFSSPFDSDLFDEGEYCFVFNPTDDGDVDVRKTSVFTIERENGGGGSEQPAEDGSLIIRKIVDGGNATADQFNFFVEGVNEGNDTDFSEYFEYDGENSYEVEDGSYDIREINVTDGYSATYENCSEVEVNSEQDSAPVCTITNTYIDRGSTGGGSGGGSTGGEVLGAFSGDAGSCGPYIFEYMKDDLQNNPAEVTKLQGFLSEQGFFVPSTGFFGPMTDKAVRDFQTQYQSEVLQPWADIGLGDGSSTGYVYKTTKWKINNIVCPGSEDFPLLP